MWRGIGLELSGETRNLHRMVPDIYQACRSDKGLIMPVTWNCLSVAAYISVGHSGPGRRRWGGPPRDGGALCDGDDPAPGAGAARHGERLQSPAPSDPTGWSRSVAGVSAGADGQAAATREVGR